MQPNGWGDAVFRRIIGPPRPGGTPEQFVVGLPFPPVLTFAPFVASVLLAGLALVLALRRTADQGRRAGFAPAATAGTRRASAARPASPTRSASRTGAQRSPAYRRDR